MDGPSQQLLNEHRDCGTTNVHFAMKTELSSSPSSQGSDTSNAPFPSTVQHADGFNSPHSERGGDTVVGQMSALQASLLSGKFSDLIVVHGEQNWTAHKVVVCAQSTVLESMIKNERGISSINLTEFPTAAVKRVLQYLYTSSYTTRDLPPEFALHSHIRVFVLASSLAIPALQTLAVQRFCYALNHHITDISFYFTSVRQIYTSTTRQNPGLRHAVTEAATQELRNMLDDEHVKKAFFELFIEIPDFQTDVLRFLADNPDRPVLIVTPHLCEGCGPMSEELKYDLDTECRSCGKMKHFEFL